MRCPKCNNEMKNIMHFEIDKNFAYHECKRCNKQTRKKRIHFDERYNKDLNK